MAAGNFGDVIKHMILLELVDVLTPKTKSGGNFNYFETHGSKMSHQVKRSSSSGVVRLCNLYHSGHPILQANLNSNKYLNFIHQYFTQAPASIDYFSSWYLVNAFLTTKEITPRIDVCEINRDTYLDTIKAINYKFPTIHYSNTEGYSLLKTYLSKGLRPSLVLIDPFYSGSDKEVQVSVSEVNHIVEVLDFYRIPFLVWYPVYSKKLKFNFINANNHIEVDNNTNNAASHMNSTGMIFSNNISHHVLGIRNDILFLDHLGLGWKVK
ncbi:23S rRNA (adenine(2030)-N(6))-methyltransferase RlmJ [Paenibacillus dokdonensis]|uniref:23S rRNA (Adenine(2030)-N(6))-methyltransferase RlmJ n=1 Tax=Paenibacillus dokdonensis TaxID=2567944 RepID=A0ABU6H056_9BACL|nr:23S rRNA (adenine(2030)-N(6))-methyltransferase RlmJ [Paenibacillus dokdonensis]MEC0244151.1 23S rRNA (adenine(2030)-N(6))-methyltransferase RlmJ [Paenibacillus dokdonensis]